jgi:DNA-binding HxlR family transcriptional regulator
MDTRRPLLHLAARGGGSTSCNARSLDISKKMLIQTLRNLERDGPVERTAYQQVPPKTEYRLTEDGRRLREPITRLCA